MHPVLLFVLAVPAVTPPPVDFQTEVIPVLTRAGCNSGACHGAAAGRGGLHLSLWGADPEGDYDALVHDQEGRRVHWIDPERSLLVRKPTADLKHGGGRRFDPDSPSATVLLNWIRAGAEKRSLRRLVRFEVEPQTFQAKAVGDAVPLRAIAHFDQGKPVDVTALAVFSAVDPTSIELNATGRATIRQRGQHTILVRFLDRIVPVRITLPLGERPVALGAVPRTNFIDDEILATLKILQLPVSAPADDLVFLRRVSLDLTGTLPTPAQIEAFQKDRRADKRARLIEALLDSAEFNDFWTLKWAKLLRVDSRTLGPEGAKAYQRWLHQQIARNTPLDRLARELICATGDGHTQGAANFARTSATAGAQAEMVSQLFMGARLRCANCHNHPLDRWTQDDYHGLSALFARLERGRVVRYSTRGEVIHPRTGEPAQPRIPGERFLEGNGEERALLARWLTDPNNPYFARAMVNRLWKEMMGRGLVEPVDDLRSTNPATHPALLDRLARDLVEHRYDLRHTLRVIALSSTYQRSSSTTASNRGDDRFYSHALEKPLSAEVFSDALTTVTGVSESFGTLPLGTRAIALHDISIPAPALDLLGRCSRQGECDEDSPRGGLTQMLHLINGRLLNDRLTAKEGRLQQVLRSQRSDVAIVQEFYLLALSRPLRPAEQAFWNRHFQDARGADERRQLFEDFLWGLLTSREFGTNH